MADSKYYFPKDKVSAVALGEYDVDGAKEALQRLLLPLGGLDFIKSGQRVVIKANLVSAMKPEEAATTHPTLVCALCELISERGATAVVGDSPGGLYNAAYVGRVYRVSGMTEVEKHGGKLNDDFSQRETVFEEAKVLNSFAYTSYLDGADHIINFCKIKSHGMMGMSAGAKNMFGAIPGIIKPEYHYRFPKYEDFADMILDLNEYFHPSLTIADGVVGMEGNGPTAGTPRKLGCLLASRSPHTLDMAAAKILGFEAEEIPTLAAARRRGLIPDSIDELEVVGNIAQFILSDFERVVQRRSMEFLSSSRNPIKRIAGKIARRLLLTRPVVKVKLCVGCGVCKNICPAETIEIKDGKAVIHRNKCIRCFCCQEFCPKSAVKVKRTAVANIFHKVKRKKKQKTRNNKFLMTQSQGAKGFRAEIVC